MQYFDRDKAMRDVEGAPVAFRASALDRIGALVAAGKPLALYLDIDGTLLDVALTPSAVKVPDGLCELLETLSSRLGGALAIVTGRRIADADELLRPAKLVAAGVHGAEMRIAPAGDIVSLSPTFGPALKTEIAGIAASLPGIITEDKVSGIALHYRLAPALRHSLLASLEILTQSHPGQFVVCEGRKVVEVLPVGFSKARALRHLATLSPFADRVPIMIGDDIADMDAIAVAESLGGFGLKVAGENFSAEESTFGGPVEVLQWLRDFDHELERHAAG